MTAVVPHTMATCRQPTRRIAVTEVPSPSAAIAISKPQRDASLTPARTVAGTRPVLLIRHQHKKHDGEDRHWNLSVLSAASSGKPPSDSDDDGQEQEHAEQLDDHGCVAGSIRNGIARSDDLGDVVDRGPEQNAEGAVVKAEKRAEGGIGDHCDCRQRVDALRP